MTRTLFAAAVAFVAIAGVHENIARAELSKGVISAFRGQFVVSEGDLPEGKNDKETIAKIKAAKLSAVTGQPNEEVTVWNFHYTAFLSKTGNTELKLNFLIGNELKADKRLTGVDPKSPVLIGDITIDEDEGLLKGKTYTVNLLAGNTKVASTTLTMK